MEDTAYTVMKYNEINLPKEKFAYLTFEHNHLVPCSIEMQEDEFVFTFFTDGLRPFSELMQCTLSEKYRALANCSELLELREEYNFSLSPNNLMYDRNLEAYVMTREGPEMENDFLNEYKALIGTFLYSKYKFEDYYLGGKDLYSKKAILRQIFEIDTVYGIRDFLLQEYEKQESNLKKHKVLVSKKHVIASRIAIPVLAMALLAVSIGGCLIAFRELPYKNRLIQANASYIAEDYLGTQEALLKVDTGRLPLSEKYILARSYVITESLTAAQKENVLAGITLKTDERVLNYWIELGRLNFEGADDYAKRLGDDELLLFALIKESATIKDNPSLTGEEKAERVRRLEEEIKSLSEQMKQGKESLLQNSSENTDGVN